MPIVEDYAAIRDAMDAIHKPLEGHTPEFYTIQDAVNWVYSGALYVSIPVSPDRIYVVSG